MVGRKNSPDSSRSSSGSTSRRNSRDSRSPSIASSLDDADIRKPVRKTTETTENVISQGGDEGLENAAPVDAEGRPGDAKSPDDLDLDDPPVTKQTSDSIESSGKKSRSSSIAQKTRSGSIQSVGNKSRSGSIANPDILDSSKNTTEIKQLEAELKKIENKSRSSSIISLGNKSRSGSIKNTDILDSSKNTADVMQLETEVKKIENKSRSGSVIGPGNKSRSGSIVNPELLETSKQVETPVSSNITKPSSTLDISDKAPEKKTQPDNSTTKSVSRNNSKKYEKSKSNSNSSALINSNLDLSARDQERARFAFSIYDFEGSGRVDGIFLGDALRALNLNPTNAVIQSLGGTTRKREKIFTVEEFLPVYAECKTNKNAGSFEDFMEVLKTYDKMEDGSVVLVELEHILLHLGERMEKNEIDAVFADCIPEEDDEGCVEYEQFLRKLCEGFM